MSEDSLMTRIIGVLQEVGGYFVWRGPGGREYVVMSKADFEQQASHALERQLHLLSETPKVARSADAMLDKINRDIALYQLQQEDVEELPTENPPAAPALTSLEDDIGLTVPSGGRRIRFESLRGDLPPELQE